MDVRAILTEERWCREWWEAKKSSRERLEGNVVFIDGVVLNVTLTGVFVAVEEEEEEEEEVGRESSMDWTASLAAVRLVSISSSRGRSS